MGINRRDHRVDRRKRLSHLGSHVLALLWGRRFRLPTDFISELTFAGVGLQTNFGELRKQGLRPLAAGAVGELVIVGITLALLLGANRVFGI